MGCGASSNVKHDLHMSHESVSLNEEERQPETPMHPEPSPLASPFATQAEREMEKGPIIKLEDLEEWERNELTVSKVTSEW